ncbi:MAG: CAP domain-containing protein [Defluviitaleaceae bacterium]|nr:CAP domain-containing protein [Defluviitaleaceae bacterium]
MRKIVKTTTCTVLAMVIMFGLAVPVMAGNVRVNVNITHNRDDATVNVTHNSNVEVNLTVTINGAQVVVAEPYNDNIVESTPRPQSPTTQLRPTHQPNGQDNPQSQIELPNRRLTNNERQTWINEYWEMGGATGNEKEVLRLVNIERVRHELTPVVWDDTLGMAARFYAQQVRDLNGILSHNFGPYATDRNAMHGASANVAAAFGANLRWNGGNGFGRGTMTAEALVNGWMNSDGHRRYILSPEHRYLGMGQKEGGISYLFMSSTASN